MQIFVKVKMKESNMCKIVCKNLLFKNNWQKTKKLTFTAIIKSSTLFKYDFYGNTITIPLYVLPSRNKIEEV